MTASCSLGSPSTGQSQDKQTIFRIEMTYDAMAISFLAEFTCRRQHLWIVDVVVNKLVKKGFEDSQNGS